MLTRTSAQDYAKDRIYMNSVDTGWINDENPHETAKRLFEKQNFQTPIVRKAHISVPCAAVPDVRAHLPGVSGGTQLTPSSPLLLLLLLLSFRVQDEEDAMARILDPLLSGVSTGINCFGKFFKDYHETEW